MQKKLKGENQMNLKKLVKLSMIATCIFMLAACGKSGTSESDSGSGSKKEVVIWDYFETDAQKEMMEDLINKFNSEQEEYEASHVYVPFADYQKQLTLGISSGDLPDLVILDGTSMASFISLDLFADISDASIDWSAYMEGPMESSMLDGKHYGIPFAANTTALFYNKDIFDKAGIEYPNEDTTWEQFQEIAKKLTANGITGFGNAAVNTDEGTFQNLQWIYTAGGSYTEPEKGTKAFELMQDMIADGSWSKESVNWTQSDVNNNFKAGNLAMQQNGPWQLPNLESDAPELNFGVTTLPKLTDDSEQATSILGGENMGVVKKDNNEGAIEFLKFYDQNEVMIEAMKKYGSFPPKTEAAQDPYWVNDEVQKMFIKQMETAIPRGPSPQWPSYSTALQTSVQEAMTNKKSAEDAAKSAQKAVDAVK